MPCTSTCLCAYRLERLNDSDFGLDDISGMDFEIISEIMHIESIAKGTGVRDRV